ncbi:hypothetical protein ACFYZ9_33555 [Streptomyces sp. NPDC001691]|uniref:hypothetical protein n=1 Tax=Streptomyces sp. NPDC001691 TaxID=3364600 RepID=UPI00367E3E1F
MSAVLLADRINRLPFRIWVPAAEAAAVTGLRPEETSPVLRKARRCGTILTEGRGENCRVMRVRRHR